MGLDMYVRKVITPGILADGTRDINEDHTEEIAYWRKHPDLHGFIMENFWSPSDENPDGNVERIPLTVERVDKIMDAVRSHTLPFTSGFFFGRSYFPEDDVSIRAEIDAEDLAKWAKVREAILAGDEVFYLAWW